MTAKKAERLFSMAEVEGRTQIVAIGIGGMGQNAMENLADTEIEGLELYSVNTDMQALDKCEGSQAVQIGAKRTAGKGAGGDSEVGRLSAEDDIEKLRVLVEGAELVFIAAGMGGGTGTGAAPVIAKLCREMGVLSIGIVTTPMDCEGRKRMEKARHGLTELHNHVDSLVVIENENLSLVMDSDDVSIIEVFKRADEVLLDGVAAISGMINCHGYINLDLADLRNVLKRPSAEGCTDALIGVGISSGEDRALKAAAFAMENPLLANGDIRGASKLLVNVTADENMGLGEAQSAVNAIAGKAGDGDREIFMGIVTDNSLGEKISVALVATGMGLNKINSPSMPEIIADKQANELPFREINEKVLVPGAIVEKDVAAGIDNNLCQKQHVGADTAVDFGVSPLVNSLEWQAPAYARRECRYSDQVLESSPVHSFKDDVREEVSALKRNRRKDRRVYREPALRIAC